MVRKISRVFSDIASAALELLVWVRYPVPWHDEAQEMLRRHRAEVEACFGNFADHETSASKPQPSQPSPEPELPAASVVKIDEWIKKKGLFRN